jgi:hypothetical protein
MSDKLNDSQQTNATVVTEPNDLQKRINEALGNVDDKGRVKFEENVDPLFKQAVLATKDARFYQADHTKSRQELAKVKAAKEVIEKQLISSTQLTAEQTEELEDLKFSDPDEWFSKKKQYEDSALTTATNKLQETIDAASSKALEELTLEERTASLHSFQERTGITLTDDVMRNDIPPRLQKKITEMPFEDYLNEVATYLKKGKVVKQTDNALDQTNIGDLAGGSANKPSKSKGYEIL